MTFQLLKDSYYFFSNHIFAILAILLPLLIPLEIAQIILVGPELTLSELTETGWLILFLNVLFTPLYTGALVFFFGDALTGASHSVGYYYRQALANWWRIFVIVSIVEITTSLGLLLLFLPGIFIAAKLALPEFICLLERRPVLDSLRDSWNGTQAYLRELFQGFLLIFAVLLFVPSSIQQWLSQLGIEGTLFQSLYSLTWAILAVYPLVFSFRVYTMYREERPPHRAESSS